MTAERVAALVARWARFYTRDLPPPVARRRIEEIDADLDAHIAHERAEGTSERRIALSLAARMLRGLAADAAWRRTVALARKPSALWVVIPTALVLLVPLVGTLAGSGAQWGVFDFVLAAVLLLGTGFLLQLAGRKPGRIAYRVAAAGIAVAAIALGEADDAPGLVLFGCLLILATLALSVRTALRSRS